MYDVICIIQARTGSTRFPKKVLKKINEKYDVISLVLSRVEKSKTLDKIIVATTTSKKDDVIVKHVKNLGFEVFRGSEKNVLSRFIGVLSKFDAKHIVRITSDCPFIDPEIIDLAVISHLTYDADYTSNGLKRTFPRGFDVEVIKKDSLLIAEEEATQEYQFEHVTPYIYEHPDLFKLLPILAPSWYARPNYRLTVDTPEDLELIKELSKLINKDLSEISFKEIIKILDSNQNLLEINKHIKQKPLK